MRAAMAESWWSSSTLSTLIWAMSSVSARVQFALGFADAGIDDAAGGDAGGAGAAEFALADDVGAGAFAVEEGEDGEVVVGLDRVVRVGVEAGDLERVGQGR